MRPGEGKGREEAERREITEGEVLSFSFPSIVHEILLKKSKNAFVVEGQSFYHNVALSWNLAWQ